MKTTLRTDITVKDIYDRFVYNEFEGKGGATDPKNCQLLCKTHNRAKGNR